MDTGSSVVIGGGMYGLGTSFATALADPSGIQLALLFWLILGRGVVRSLRRPYHLHSHRIRRH